MQRFRVKGKLAPRYAGPYEITKICGPVAYKVRLPPQLSTIYGIFHVSLLKRCVQVPTEIIQQQDIHLEPDLSYQELPIKILDQMERVTRRKVVRMFKSNGIITPRMKPHGKLKAI